MLRKISSLFVIFLFYISILGNFVSNYSIANAQNTFSLSDITFTDIAYGNGTFVAIGKNKISNEGRVFTSYDGESWIFREINSTYTFATHQQSLVWNGTMSKFIALRSDTASKFLVSGNGIDWEEQDCGLSANNGKILTLFWDGNKMVASASHISYSGATVSGKEIYTSNSINFPIIWNVKEVSAYTRTGFSAPSFTNDAVKIAVTDGGNSLVYNTKNLGAWSADLGTTIDTNLNGASKFRIECIENVLDVVYSSKNNKFISTYQNSASSNTTLRARKFLIIDNTNGAGASVGGGTGYIPYTDNVLSLAIGNDKVVAGTRDGKIYRFDNEGSNMAAISSQISASAVTNTKPITAMAYGNGKFVGVGEGYALSFGSGDSTYNLSTQYDYPESKLYILNPTLTYEDGSNIKKFIVGSNLEAKIKVINATANSATSTLIAAMYGSDNTLKQLELSRNPIASGETATQSMIFQLNKSDISYAKVFYWNGFEDMRNLINPLMLEATDRMDDITQSGLKLWLDAENINLNDNETISTWQDKSSSGYNAVQSNDENKPVYRKNYLNGKSVVHFDGDNKYLQSNFNPSIDIGNNNDFTVLFVSVPEVPGGNMISFGAADWLVSGGQRWFFGHSDLKWYSGYSESTQRSTITALKEGAAIISCEYNSLNKEIKYSENGIEANRVAYTGLGLLPNLPINIGAVNKKPNTADYFINGNYAEILVYNRLLSKNESDYILAYLSGKYGFVNSLTTSDVRSAEGINIAINSGYVRKINFSNNITTNINTSNLLDINFGNYSLDGNVTLTTNSIGTMKLEGSGTAAHITGDLTVNSNNASITNYSKVTGNVVISNINTWDEYAQGNTLIWDAEGGKLNIKNNANVVVFNKPTNVTGGKNIGTAIINSPDVVFDEQPLEISAQSTYEPKLYSDLSMQLVKEINISPYKGTFMNMGDLNNDGQGDFLLSYVSEYSATKRLIALNNDGTFMWEVGDSTATKHDTTKGEPNCKDLVKVYDLDGDGASEVIVELWNNGSPILKLLNGATGQEEASIISPFDMSVRNPVGYNSSRPVPQALFVHADGEDQLPTLVITYQASSTIPTHAVALNADLEVLWRVDPTGTKAIGHMPTVTDITGDGKDDIVLGAIAVTGHGETIYNLDSGFGSHTDMTNVVKLPSGEIFILTSVCGVGPSYAIAPNGSIIWSKTKGDVPHGQAIWGGNFIHNRDGMEAIILRSGHYGDFITVDLSNGANLYEFQQELVYEAYPDMPTIVNWTATDEQALWIAADRTINDGRGIVLGHLGENDAYVVGKLKPGVLKTQLPIQSMSADICGDERQEVVLYQQYQGESIFIFTQKDSNTTQKPYVHRESVYHHKSYF